MPRPSLSKLHAHKVAKDLIKGVLGDYSGCNAPFYYSHKLSNKSLEVEYMFLYRLGRGMISKAR